MDKETAAAFATLSAALALVAGRLERIEKGQAEIVRLLTPKKGEGPSAQERIAQLVAEMRGGNAAVTGYLKDIAKGVRDVPLDTVAAIHDNLDVPRRGA